MISIIYLPTKDTIVSNDILTLYDFGDKKGFLYKNEFTIYTILKKDCIEHICETCELFNGIPMTALSIENYPCIYDTNIYKIPFFNIILTEMPPPVLHLQPSERVVQMARNPKPLLQSQPKVEHHQPPSRPASKPQNRNNKKMPLKEALAPPNGVNVKITQAQQYQQSPLEHHTLPQQQWRSLDQLMRQPSLSHVKLPHPAPAQEGRHSQSLMKPQPVLQVRQLQKKAV